MINGHGFKLKEKPIFASLIYRGISLDKMAFCLLLTNMAGKTSYSLQATGFKTTHDFAIAMKNQENYIMYFLF